MKLNFKRFCTFLCVIILGLNQLSAVPAYRGWQTKTQPDGTTITVRLMGDEFFHYWQNEDGQQVTKDANGWWNVNSTPAVQTDTQKAKQASRRYNQPSSPIRKAAGSINLAPRGLVILVNFTDKSFRSENTRAAMSDMMNAENYTYNSATGSVREFFKAQSNGAYVPDFDVVGPYTISNTQAHYGGNDSNDDDLLAGDMIVEACKAADADGVDFTKYNNDGDNEVDFVYVIYAGEGEADSDDADAVWPHNWTLESAYYYNNCTYAESQRKVDNLYINNYACSGELRGRSTTRCPIGTIAHEFGHVLGLPDYYVTSSSAANDEKDYTPGSWHIMDYGSYNNDGRTPPNYSPHDKYYFGWTTPTLLAKDAKKNCTLTTTYGSAYQITGGTTLKAATASDRVWYLENRQKTGWDKYLPGHGMVVWEVQYNSSNWTNNTPNNSAVGYTVVTANSLTRPYTPYVTDPTASSTSGTTFPGTKNVRSYTPATGCALTEITESAGTITFKYNGGETKTQWDYSLLGDNCTVPADGTVALNGTLNLTITPDAGYSLADAACWMVEMGGTDLTYGTDFTYNPSTNKFTITTVTGDVTILAEAAHLITWVANGVTHATNVAADNKITLPSVPSDCSGTGGKKFVGWCTNASYSNATTAPTFAKTGDTYSVSTYYAVYATAGSGGGSSSGPAAGTTLWAEDFSGYSANDVPSGSTANSHTGTTVYDDGSVSYSVSNGGGTTKVYNENTGGGTAPEILIAKSDGSLTISDIPTGNASEMTLSFSSNKTTFSVTTTETSKLTISGSGKSWTISVKTGQTAPATFDLTIKNTGSSNSRVDNISLVVKTAGSGGGSSTSYSDYSTTCSTCTLSSITLNTDAVTKTFTQGDAFSSEGLVVTAKYSDCSDRTVSPTSVSEPDMTTTGSKTITVTYTEGSTTKTATYTITVNPLPTYTIRFFDGTTQIGTNQEVTSGQSATKPSDPADCTDNGYTFVGWYTSKLADDNTTVTSGWITDFTATQDQDYYAVYSHTEDGGSGSGSDDVEFNFGYANDWGQTSTWSGTDRSTVEATKGGVTVTHTRGTGSMYANSTSTRFYKDNTLTFTVSTGSITSIVFTCSTYQTDITSNVGTCTATSSVLSWTGDATSVSFTRPSNASSYAQFSNAKITVSGSGSSTTYYTGTKNCVTPTEVTVTFHKNDGSDATTSQTIPYNTATALTANTFSRTGYEFIGWATSASGTKVYDNQASVTLTKNTNLYALWQKKNYNVTFTPSISNGTVTVNSQSTSPQSAEFESTVTVTVTPAAGYVFGTLVVKDADNNTIMLSGEGNTRTFTMPASDVSVTATVTAIPTYNAVWSVNGSTTTQTAIAGTKLSELTPAIPEPTSASCDNVKVFVGWTTNPDFDGSNADHIAAIITSTADLAMPASDITYYAVFAKKGEGSGTTTVTDEITYSTIGVTGTSYADWVNKSDKSAAFYAGNSAGGNNSIQLRSSNSTAGIVSTTSGGKVTKIVIEWNSNTSATRYVDIYGSNTAYSAASDLYNTSTQGTLLGSLCFDNNNNGVELNVTGDYAYVGLRSRSSALYLDKVSITWSSSGGTSYSEYTISCGPSITIAPETLTAAKPNEGTGTLTATANLFTPTSWTWDTSDASVATVSGTTATATVTYKASGTCTITCTASDGSTTKSATATVKVPEAYTVTLIDNGVTYTETAYEGTPYTLPDEYKSTCPDITFLGWAAGEYTDHATGTSVAPSYTAGGEEVNITAATTFVAVYSTVDGEPTDDYVDITQLSDLTTGDYLFATANSGLTTAYPMTNTITDNHMGEVTLSVSSKKITTTNNSIIWHVTKSGSNYTIYNSAVGKYLALSTSSPLLQNEAHNYTVVYDEQWIFESTTVLGYQLSAGTITDYFESATSQEYIIHLFKRQVATSYTSHPDCCHEPATPLAIGTEINTVVGSGVIDFTLSGGNGKNITWSCVDNNNTDCSAYLANTSNSGATLNAPTAATTKVYTVTATQPDDETDPDNVICGATVSRNITVKTQWTITYKTIEAGFENTYNSVTVTDGESYIMPDLSGDYSCPDEVSFAGWATDKNATVVGIAAGASSVANANATWYAVWQNASGSTKETRAKYEPITDASTLAANQVLVLASGNAGLTTMTSGDYAPVSLNGKSADDDSYITFPSADGIQELILKGTAGAWHLYTGSKYIVFGNKKFTLVDNENEATDLTISITDGKVSISGDVLVSGSTSTFTLRYNYNGGTNPRFAPYTSTTLPLPVLYKKNGTVEVDLATDITYSTNTTCTSGALIRANTEQWITAANGQKIKGFYTVTAKGFDDATTLSIAANSDSHFTATLEQTAVPAGATGLTTNLVIEYTPTEANTANATTITLTAGDITKTITVNGRSLPDEFLLITKKTLWYALPANMSNGSGQYDGITVSPDDAAEPTIVPIAPPTAIYSLKSVANARYSTAGQYVRLVGNNNKALWANGSSGATGIQNYAALSESNAEQYEWKLATTDGVHYTVSNPAHPDATAGRILAYGSKFGLYKDVTTFCIVPAGCTSQPQDVNVSPRRVDATFSWMTNAASVTIQVYTDEQMTALAKTENAASSPYTMYGLSELTDYWYKIIPGTDETCAVTGTFKTTGPIIDIVEWQENAAVIFVDKDENLNPVVVIDGQEEHGTIGGGGQATELFFAKYFEGAGTMKLLSIFNGTPNDINLANYMFCDHHAGGGNKSSFASTDTEYPLSGLGTIYAGQEIIFFTPDASTGVADCSAAFLAEVRTHSSETDNPRWIECGKNKFADKDITFNGNDALLLKKNGTIIDVIGALSTPGRVTNCRGGDSEYGWSGSVKNMDYGKSPSDPAFAPMFEASSKTPGTTAESIEILAGFGIDLENEYIDLTTARCILFRNKEVTSGEKAAELNTGDDFVTFSNYTYEGENYSSEWYGRSVCMDQTMKTAAGVTNDAQATCNSYQDLAAFDYSEYYIDYQNIEPGMTLDGKCTDTEAKLYTIPIEDLSKYTCLNLRFQLKKDGEVLTETPTQVPIIISADATTKDAIFSEIMKDKVADPTNAALVQEQSEKRCKTCNVVVLSNVTLSKSADSDAKDVPQINDLKVYPGGKVIVPEGTNYTVNSLALRRQEDEIATADIKGNLTINKPGKSTYLDIRIDPTNWHYISLPYDVNVSDITFSDGITPAVLGTDYLLAWYNGAYRAEHKTGGWTDVAPDATLKKGLGYIMAIPGNGKVQREFRFPMANAVIEEEKADKQVDGLYGYGGDKTDEELRPNHKGWNLLGNPYMMPYTSNITEPLATGELIPDPTEDPWLGHYIIKESTKSLRYFVEPIENGWSGYQQVAIGTGYEMKPFTSYFVQVGISGSTLPTDAQGVEFSVSKKKSSIIRRSPAEYEDDKHPVWCGVVLTADANREKDETALLISDNFTNGYDMMDDLIKWRGDYYQYYQKPVLASRNDAGEMAFNALPDNSAKAGVPLNFFAAAQGQYTLALDGRYSLDEVKEVQLFDSELGVWHNLMTGDYAFNAKRGDNTTRFTLYVSVERKQPQTPTDVDNIYGPLTLTAVDKTLVLSGLQYNADIYVYDMSGKLMAADRYVTDGNNSAWRTTVPAQGVYFVRVISGTEQQTLNTIVY